jgi:hypothetical protein
MTAAFRGGRPALVELVETTAAMAPDPGPAGVPAVDSSTSSMSGGRL